jgi:serine/threonine-protein kinase
MHDRSRVGESLEIGSYRVVRRLALGERSEVLLARVHGPYGFQRTVVLKRLIGSHARDPQWLRRLAAEAIAYARLSHSAIVRLYDFVDLDGTPALVLEYVPGISLETLVQTKRDRGERLGDAEVLYIGARVFAALAAAHGARHPETGEFSPVIHRDVSPGNVLVSTHGEVKLTDFGIARVAGVTDETPSGTLLGTYGYMAPEQINGDSITVRADVYGAALLLWELLAGRHAFERASLPELEILQAMAAPRIPSIDKIRPELPLSIIEALSLALRANADERISARDMLEVLRGHVKSTDARAALADGLARARRPRSTIPDDAPESRAWTAYAASVDPDAMSEGTFATMADLPDTLSDSGARRPMESATTPTTPLAEPELQSLAERDRHSDTPTAIVTHDELPMASVEPRRMGRWVALLGSMGAALVAGFAVVASGAHAGAPAPAASATRTARSFVASPPRDRVTPRGRAEWVEPLPDDTGLLDTPSALWNHRVFVDGQARGAGGDIIRLPCGKHTVRLGSTGRTQTIDVPCGGTVAIDR